MEEASTFSFCFAPALSGTFHKTHPSGSGIVTKIAPSAAKIKPSVTNKGTGAKQGVPNVTGEESTKSEAESWGRDKDDSNNDHDSSSEGSDQDSDSVDDNTQSDKGKGSDFVHETDENETDSKSNQEENEEEVEDDEEEKDDKFVKTPSNYTDDEDETNVESKVEYNAEGNGDKGMDCTTNQFDDDVDIFPKIPVLVITEFSPVYTTVILQSLPSFTPPPPQSTPTPPPTTEAINPLSTLLNSSFVFQLNNRVSTLEKEVIELKNDDLLNTQETDLVDVHLDSRLGATKDQFMSYLSTSNRITVQVKI
ncbi:hypothetical protein Tco_1246613 [Tanacetum coccineum]